MAYPLSVFSARLPASLAPNAVSRALAALRDAGVSLRDLTVSNPTSAGISYPPDVLSSLGDPAAAVYAPDPAGLAPARAAVSADYRRRGLDVPPNRIVLAASTSEAYAFLFKLVCDAGDEVLAPQPSYPLFEWLTRLDAVILRTYRLDYHGAWSIDRDTIAAQASARTRAVLVVSPNNPTGGFLSDADREWLDDWCAARGAALIVDEVFADYPLRSPGASVRSWSGHCRALTFALGGLSKSAGLPQVKLAWVSVDGPEPLVAGALDRLGVIADTYLSVSTPVQIAAPRLFAHGAAIRAAIHARLAENLAALRALAAAAPAVTLLEPDAGWSAVLRVPATIGEEALVLRLLHDAHVIVHPGYFFDFADEAYVVVSLLPEPAVFREGAARVITIAAQS
jgi:aspartate/methionine/tyrosine aminotransferase